MEDPAAAGEFVWERGKLVGEGRLLAFKFSTFTVCVYFCISILKILLGSHFDFQF